MRKKMLEKRLAKLEAKRQSLGQRALESQDAAEVRSLNDQIADINEQVEDIREEISVIEAEEAEKKAEEARAAEAEVENRGVMPQVNGNIVNAFSQNAENRASDPYASMEYREAFKAYVQKGVAIPSNLLQRSDGPTTSQDLGAIVPTTVMNEIIKNLPGVYGQLYKKCRHTSIPGGVRIPVADLSASFKWINETTVSPDQKAGDTSYIEFGYNIAEIRITETLLASIVSLGRFESEISSLIAEAYVQAMDNAIVNGSGKGAPLGMLNDPRVPADHRIEMTAADFADWKQFRKKVLSKIPMRARNFSWITSLSTSESYIHTMCDSNGQPIFREATVFEMNDSDGVSEGRFFGREMTYVEPDILPDFDAAQAGDVVMILWNPNDYIINSNLGFGVKRYFDDSKNCWVNKGLTIVDGRLGSVDRVYFIVKK
jgi:HK97 family phage major capsid protein